ncbi:hypothetical protein FF1_033534 [Malus domestica]|uniref:Uncharacterized protein n=1 Tax=Malus domestica TaxID=3750 RepID=A0A498K1B3_MALDO|nr:hypothetical protein DVH24_015299 [Malus domestica]
MKAFQIVFFSGHHRDQETHRHRDLETHHHRDRECDRWTRNDHYRRHETHETHHHRDYHDPCDHRTDHRCRDYYDPREQKCGTHHHRHYHDYRERKRGTHHHPDGRVTKVLLVSTRPRSKRRYECRMKRESLRLYVKNLGLTPAELQEKVRKVREARDYSFLLSEECDNSVDGVQENNNVRLYNALTKTLNQNNPHHFGAAPSKLSEVGRVESVEKKHGGSPRSLLEFVRDDADDDDVPSLRKKSSKRRIEGGESAAKKPRICKIDGGDDEQ